MDRISLLYLKEVLEKMDRQVQSRPYARLEFDRIEIQERSDS